MRVDAVLSWEKIQMEYIQNLKENPLEVVILLIDIGLVALLAYLLFRMVKGSRAWQLVKGIALVVVITMISEVLKLQILNAILTSIMNIGVIAIMVIFQPELRRGLEQLGTNKVTKFFGINRDIITKTKEDIYKIVIAASELAKVKKGALIVIERDIKIQDIIATGIALDSEISPQILVNIFEPNTPLHDGAVIISNNKIAAAACVLPLANDRDIAKELGTRHRAAIGISSQSDSLVVVVSEETGKISVAKDGTLIADVREDVLKKILISNIITKRYAEDRNEKPKKIFEFNKSENEK